MAAEEVEEVAERLQTTTQLDKVLLAARQVPEAMRLLEATVARQA